MERILGDTVPYLFPALFAGIWIAVSHLLSRFSGWLRLSGRYRSSQPVPGKVFRFRSGRERALPCYLVPDSSGAPAPVTLLGRDFEEDGEDP